MSQNFSLWLQTFMLEKSHKNFFQYSPKFSCLKSPTNFFLNIPLKFHVWKLSQLFPSIFSKNLMLENSHNFSPQYFSTFSCLKTPTNFSSISPWKIMLEKSHKYFLEIPLNSRFKSPTKFFLNIPLKFHVWKVPQKFPSISP